MANRLYGLLNLQRRQRRRALRGLWGPRRRVWVLPAYLAAIFALHVAAMMLLEGMTLVEGVWLTATTVVTVGYGDLSAKTPAGRFATMALMYVGAIFVVAVAINNWLDAKADRAERKARGTWRWGLGDHLLIIGTPDRDAEEFFCRLARQVRHARGWEETPIQLLTTAYRSGLPSPLRDLGVVHRHGRGGNVGDLAECDVLGARGVVILAASETDEACDAQTFDLIDRLREAGYRGPIVAECVDDANRPRLTRAGATSLLRPMRGFPEALTRALFAPGAEAVIENLFTAEGDECLLVPLPRPCRARWADVVSRLVVGDVGTPIAYRDPNGRVSTNPPGTREVEIADLYVIVHDRQEETVRERVAALVG